MFEYIGIKIMSLAKVMAWIGIVVSIIVGLMLLANDSILGMIVMALGSLMSWVSSFVLYGFGQLIDDVSVLKQKALEKESSSYKNDSINK